MNESHVPTAKTINVAEAQELILRSVENPLQPVAAHDLAQAIAVVMVRNGLLGFVNPQEGEE